MDKLRVSVSMGLEDEEARDARVQRGYKHDALLEMYRAWVKGPSRSYESFRDELVEAAVTGALERPEIRMALDRRLERSGCPPEERPPVLKGFSASEQLRSIPAIRVRWGLLAAFAAEASANRGREPDRGFYYDTLATGSYLPYCEAMLIDRQCGRLLEIVRARRL